MENPEEIRDPRTVGARLRNLRKLYGLSMRQLAKQAEVTVSYISAVEAGRISPTISTLRKLLAALGTDLGAFFTVSDGDNKSFIFRREEMHAAVDAGHHNKFILPRRLDIRVEILDEVITIRPDQMPEYEVLASDITGYILQGDLTIDIKGEESQLLRQGDAFYVTAGNPIRGYCSGDNDVRLITVYIPARY